MNNARSYVVREVAAEGEEYDNDEKETSSASPLSRHYTSPDNANESWLFWPTM
jgi:hypothetical protein